MDAGAVVVFGLASILFLSMMLLAAAVLLRGQWDTLGTSSQQQRPRQPRNKYAPRLPE